MDCKDRPIKLLWTGGWDSTFRLLCLLLIREKKVQPYYLVDADRLSAGTEIRAMEQIRNHLFEKHPKTQNLLLPFIFKAVCDIRPNRRISRSFERIAAKRFLGSQYEWLARFCDEAGIYDMELSVHRDDQLHKAVEGLVIEVDSENGPYWRIDDKFEGEYEHAVFKFFAMPVFNLSKLEMRAISIENGFYEFMEQTWFCNRPRKNCKPCGICNPCAGTMQEGLGMRIPISGRMRYYFYVIPVIKTIVKKHPALYRPARRIRDTILRSPGHGGE